MSTPKECTNRLSHKIQETTYVPVRRQVGTEENDKFYNGILETLVHPFDTT